MATYITLMSYTDAGIKNVKEVTARLAAARETAAGSNAAIKQFYLTLGQHDAVVVSEAPDDITMAQLLLGVAGTGNVRTQTLRAFNRTEMAAVLAKMP